MALLNTIIDRQGPLPISGTFQTTAPSEVSIFVSGSVFTGTEGASVGIAILLDGNKIGTAMIWSNGPSTHRAVVPEYITKKLSFTGTHKIELEVANANTITDINDSFRVAVMLG